MSFNTISAIVRGLWLIDRSYVDGHLPLIFNIVSGKSSGAELFKGNAEYEQPFVFNNGQRFPMTKWVFQDGQGYVQVLNEDAWPANSVGVIPTIGPIMKYNGDCGEPGMIQRTAWANTFANSPKIGKIVSWIDSPGGQADGTPQYAEFIKSIDKPKTAYVDGGAYSAGAWISSAHDDIVLSNTFTGFGSIGAYCSFVDYSGYYKKMGIKVKDEYAKQSTEKNDAYRKAQKGDMSGYQQFATDCAAAFIDQFATNRGDALKNSSWNTGKIFNGNDVIDLGLADSIGPFSLAATIGKSKNYPVNPSKNSNNNTMKLTNVEALANVESPTEEQIDLANGDLTSAGITKVTLVAESFIQDAAAETTRANGLTEQVTSLTEQVQAGVAVSTELATAKTTIEANATRITELENQVAAFGKNAGDRHRNAGGADVPPEGADNMASILDNLAHNKTADQMLG